MTKYSKLYALNPADGSIKWQRAVMGRLSDFHYINENKDDTVVLVINYDDTKSAQIRE